MKFGIALILAALVALPARADDVEDSIAAALDAYHAGDIKKAKEEVDFASQLLGQMKAEGLSEFLPEALDGWERQDAETDSQAMTAFGGGQMAEATYTSGDQRVDVQIMADNQMVTAMAAMFSNPMMMGAMGKVERIGGEKVVITEEGDIQALIGGRILVQIGGSADTAAKEQYFEAIDVEGLKKF